VTTASEPWVASNLDLSLVRYIEEASFRAWPALRTEEISGWVLRFSNGQTKRANSVNVLFADPERDLTAAIDAAEQQYEAAGQPTIFRITPLAEPELEGNLEARCYGLFDQTLVMSMPAPAATIRDPDVLLEPAPGKTWFDGFCRFSPGAAQQRDTLHTMLGRVEGRACYARIHRDGEPVAFGMSVVEGERAGFFEILVAPAWRGH
jgi:hypothetical protein